MQDQRLTLYVLSKAQGALQNVKGSFFYGFIKGGIEMRNDKGKTIEVRWHGRGGQGAKSASAILAEVLFEGGKYVQAFPEYGAERQGAPMRAYNRVSDYPIRRRCSVKNPNIVVVVDPTMIESSNPCEGCTRDAVYLVNTAEDANKLRERMKLSKSAKVLAVDATKITLEELGQKQTECTRFSELSHVYLLKCRLKNLRTILREKWGQLPERVLEANRRATISRTRRGGTGMSKPQTWQDVPPGTVAWGASALSVETGLWRSMPPRFLIMTNVFPA